MILVCDSLFTMFMTVLSIAVLITIVLIGSIVLLFYRTWHQKKSVREAMQ